MSESKAAELANLTENAEDVMRAIGGMSGPDAVVAIGTVLAKVLTDNWPPERRWQVFSAMTQRVQDLVEFNLYV